MFLARVLNLLHLFSLLKFAIPASLNVFFFFLLCWPLYLLIVLCFSNLFLWLFFKASFFFLFLFCQYLKFIFYYFFLILFSHHLITLQYLVSLLTHSNFYICEIKKITIIYIYNMNNCQLALSYISYKLKFPGYIYHINISIYWKF